MPRYEQKWSAQTNPAVLAKTISFIVSWPDDFFLMQSRVAPFVEVESFEFDSNFNSLSF